MQFDQCFILVVLTLTAKGYLLKKITITTGAKSNISEIREFTSSMRIYTFISELQS
jgi:hypothetical protein